MEVERSLGCIKNYKFTSTLVIESTGCSPCQNEHHSYCVLFNLQGWPPMQVEQILAQTHNIAPQLILSIVVTILIPSLISNTNIPSLPKRLTYFFFVPKWLSSFCPARNLRVKVKYILHQTFYIKKSFDTATSWGISK